MVRLLRSTFGGGHEAPCEGVRHEQLPGKLGSVGIVGALLFGAVHLLHLLRCLSYFSPGSVSHSFQCFCVIFLDGSRITDGVLRLYNQRPRSEPDAGLQLAGMESGR